jgi:hypothetical protein
MTAKRMSTSQVATQPTIPVDVGDADLEFRVMDGFRITAGEITGRKMDFPQ